MLYSSWPAVSTTNTSYSWPCTWLVRLSWENVRSLGCYLHCLVERVFNGGVVRVNKLALKRAELRIGSTRTRRSNCTSTNTMRITATTMMTTSPATWTNWMTRLDLPTDREPITAIFLCFKGIFAPSGYWCICKGLHINSDLSDCNYHTMYTSLCSSVSLLDIVFLIYIFCLTTICRRSVFEKQFFKLCFHILARPRARLQLE